MPSSPSQLVDWPIAVRVARVVAGSGPPTTPQVRGDLRRDFDEFTPLADALVRDFTGLAPAEPAPAPHVLDRAGWVRANLDGFRDLLHPLAEKIAQFPLTGMTRRLTSAAVGVQIGVLLGYLSQKVLGQYDVVLASEGAGRVYYVGPNVVEAERRHALAPRDFRLWITLHEITHRTQFTGVPWLRARMRQMVARAVASMELDPEHLRNVARRGRDLLLQGPHAWRAENVMTLLMSEEQRSLLGEMQALMTVVEGHGTFVMNRVGEREIASWPQLRAMLERRRVTGAAERAFQRAIGMEMKYEQYKLGERFMDDVAARAGADAVNKVWEREGNLPTLDEMREPERWLARVTR